VNHVRTIGRGAAVQLAGVEAGAGWYGDAGWRWELLGVFAGGIASIETGWPAPAVVGFWESGDLDRDAEGCGERLSDD
jgi:hypothetical protein